LERTQMKINYFDMGLCDGEELQWMVDSILPSLGIENYRAYGFEACRAFYNKLRPKFAHYDRVMLVNRAISNRNGAGRLYYSWESKEGHSIFDTKCNVDKDKFETVECVLFSDWLKETVPDFAESFNILRFNIEGAEWHLIDDLVKNDLAKHIDIFCGHGDDVKKIGDYKNRVNEYYELLKRHHINILSFCSICPETQKPLTNVIRDKLALKQRNCR
jgi:FkbM family methyltransferase